jgi:hypothetical protein
MRTLYGIILALFFIVLGIIGVILPWSVAIRTELVDFLLSNTFMLTLLGLLFLFVGAGVIFQMLHGMKRRYITLKELQPHTIISEEVIRDYLKIYFDDLFPKTPVPCRIALKRKKAKVLADLPYVAEKDQEALTRKIEKDLSDIFRELIGWRHDLFLAISFAPK